MFAEYVVSNSIRWVAQEQRWLATTNDINHALSPSLIRFT